MTAAITDTPPADTRKVLYEKLDGGLNTAKAPNDLDRNEFAQLINYWYSYGSALSKRPGSQVFIGPTGDGVAITSVLVARFANVSYVVVQTALNNIYAAAVTAGAWTKIGTCSGGILRGAMMYDPKTSLDTLFLVTGHDTPQMWQGPSTVLVNVTTGNPSAGFLPNKPGTGAGATNPIQPKYVSTLGNNSHLFYSGDSSAPCAVYISDAFNPESFTTPAMQADPYGYTGSGGTFLPALIGFNDGVDGGDVTGLQTLGFTMVIFKESAVYAMVQTQLLGNVAWQVYNVTSTRGALSPRSIVAFDQFIAFLSIDGVYITYGQPTEQITKQKISANVPTLFDATGFGQVAQIGDRTSAVAGRIGNRYVIFYDVYGGADIDEATAWFDFDVIRPDGLPAAGQFTGISLGGMAPTAGPGDQGLMIIGDGLIDYVGTFGLGFTDRFGSTAPSQITTFMLTKNDCFVQEFGAEAILRNKVPARLTLVIQMVGQALTTTTNNFFVNFLANNSSVFASSSIPIPALSVTPGGGFSGYELVDWRVIPARPQKTVVGFCLQAQIVEASTSPYVIAGMVWELDARQVSR
jgi:hypothetical protein